ncbi:hypothetical protein [Jannaschia seohaensis]|nr:hypothetical protein [Jannaschia seohaensis]
MDLSTGTVLAWDSDLKWPQEELDALCGLAARLLSAAPGNGPEMGMMRAMLATETGCQVFQRGTPQGDEVFGCILAPEAAIDDVFEAAAWVFDDLLPGDRAALA